MAYTAPERVTPEVLDELPREIRDKPIEHKQYTATQGEDMPAIRNWRWSLGTTAQGAGGRSRPPRGKKS